jgi:hypothetical protein
MSQRLGQVLFCLALAVIAAGAGPATRPVEVPREKQLALWFMGLSDADATVRRDSRQKLLEMKRADLVELKKGLEPLAPLDEKMTAVLHDIVLHVWLRELAYAHDPMGFLGITVGADRNHVVVDNRMPGFCAYQSLEDGDLILDIEEHPLRQPAQREEFIDTVKECRPGEVVHFKVLRQGKELRVRVKLDGRPADPTDGANPWGYEQQVQELVGKRWAAAERYWQDSFGSVGTVRGGE